MILFCAFRRLILTWKVREDNQFMTEKVEIGGVLDPNWLAEDNSGLMNKKDFKYSRIIILSLELLVKMLLSIVMLYLSWLMWVLVLLT